MANQGYVLKRSWFERVNWESCSGKNLLFQNLYCSPGFHHSKAKSSQGGHLPWLKIWSNYKFKFATKLTIATSSTIFIDLYLYLGSDIKSEASIIFPLIQLDGVYNYSFNILAKDL